MDEEQKDLPAAGPGEDHETSGKGQVVGDREKAKTTAGSPAPPSPPRSPLQSKDQFIAEGPGPWPREERLVPLAEWRRDGPPLATAALPAVPGLYVVRCLDVRPIAAQLRAGAAPEDRALDIEADDGHTLLAHLRLCLAGPTYPARLAIHPGHQGNGEEFWKDAKRDLGKIQEQCLETGCAVFVAADGEMAGDHSKRHELPAIDIEVKPLIEALMRDWGRAEEEFAEISELLDRGQFKLLGLIAALDERNEGQLQVEIRDATRGETYSDEVAAFIRTHILDSEEPAEIAAAFTAICFDQLTSNEFRRIAQDLAETPGLVEMPPAKPNEAAPVPRTRVREDTLIKVDVRNGTRLIDGMRTPLLILNGALRFRELLRRELPSNAIFTAANFLDQMSARLVHGVVAPERWDVCCDVLGQILINEAGASPERLGPRIAGFWLCADGTPISDRARTQHIVAHGDVMLRRLCERTAERAQVDLASLQSRIAGGMIGTAQASSTALAWRTPTAASFVVQSLGTLSPRLAEGLLQSCIDGPPELLTIVCAGLTGGFGLEAQGDSDTAHLDARLATLARIADDGEAGDTLRQLAQGLCWRLASRRLAVDGQRFAEGLPPTISDALAAALLRYASRMANADAELFENLPFDARWLDKAGAYAALEEGWRAPPPYYRTPTFDRAAVLAAEFAYQPTIHAYDVLTAQRQLASGVSRREAMGAFASRLGLHGAPIDTVDLWIPTRLDLAVEIDEEALGEHADEFHAMVAGIQNFRAFSCRLRRAIPLLAVAFAQVRMVGAGTDARIEVVLPDAIIEAVRDKKVWSGLCTAVEALRETLEAFETIWGEAIDMLPRSDQLRAAKVQGRLQRRIFPTWWGALTRARLAAGSAR